ncbi:hypothetical protein [Peptostreptococcus russellii]|uniref:hypothetical protein n=1 Tax=Peptostreptococcus russellii TaxID=215200 RepID=UPI003F580CF1
MSDIFAVKLIDIIDEGDKRVSLYFDIPKDFVWEAGAHISLALEGYDNKRSVNKDYVRKFSIQTLMNEGKIGVTTRLDSSDSVYKEKIASLKIGDYCYIIESGCRMSLRRENKDIVLISMGVGMATMRPLVHAFEECPDGIRSLTNICVNKTDNILYKNEFDSMKDICDSHCCHNREELKVDLAEICKESKDKIFYLVGSKPFVENMVSQLRGHNVAKENIVIDKKTGVLDGIYAGASFNSYKDFKSSSSFKAIELPKKPCDCNGNCTCK